MLLRHLSGLLENIFSSSFAHDTGFRIITKLNQLYLEFASFFKKISVIESTGSARADDENPVMLLS